MKPIPHSESDAGHFHAVRFYQDDISLCRIVSEFFGFAFITRQPALTICREHTHIVGADGEAAPIGAAESIMRQAVARTPPESVA